jgi:hypothetical protein
LIDFAEAARWGRAPIGRARAHTRVSGPSRAFPEAMPRGKRRLVAH